jgi:Chemotaxis phosphatase CheX
MDPAHFSIFRDITLEYFAKLAPDESPPALEEAFIQFAAPVLLDYASVVGISGEYEGCLYLTTTRPLLRRLLELQGEGEISERTIEDMCRELSNVLSGNATRAFGAQWKISVPRTLRREDFAALLLPPSTFTIPIRWASNEAFLVIGLQPAATSAPSILE